MVATPQTSTQLSSLSRVSVRLGTTPREVLRVANEIHVQPAVFLDDAMYFDDPGVERIAEHLKPTKDPG